MSPLSACQNILPFVLRNLFISLSSLSKNAVADKLEKAMSPPVGAHAALLQPFLAL